MAGRFRQLAKRYKEWAKRHKQRLIGAGVVAVFATAIGIMVLPQHLKNRALMKRFESRESQRLNAIASKFGEPLIAKYGQVNFGLIKVEQRRIWLEGRIKLEEKAKEENRLVTTEELKDLDKKSLEITLRNLGFKIENKQAK